MRPPRARGLRPSLTKEEHTNTRRRIAQAIGILALAAVGCDVGFILPRGSSFPTAAPGSIETIVAGTAGAAQTQTAELIPATATMTFTPTITRTPTVTPSPTATFLWLIRSPTPRRTATPTLGPATGQFACRLLDQDPEDNSRISRGTDFDAVWEVRNTGEAAWGEGDIDFAYVSGRKMHEQPVYDLSENVNPGETVNLIVDMKAPKDPGTYKVEWTLRRGSNDFCHLNMTIIVK